MDILKKTMAMNTYFAFSGKNKEVLTKYTELWDKIECLNQTINCGRAGE